MVSNVMSLVPKIDEISYVVTLQDADIACFTETWLRDIVDNQVINIPNYTLFRKDRVFAQHGGVCLYVKNSINSKELKDLEDPSRNTEVLWSELKPRRLLRGFSRIIIGVVYHPPSADDNYMINYLLDTLGKIECSYPNAGIIITGDFNRLDISQIINHYNLKQLVNFPTRGERTLDLVLTNFEKYYNEPNKLAPFGLSDHCTISLYPRQRARNSSAKKTILTRNMRPSARNTLGRYFTSVDWTVIDTIVITEEKLDFLNCIINIGLDNIMPTKTVKIHENDPPWMTGQLKQLIRKRQETLISNPTLFKFYRNKVNKERKECKSKYYQSRIKGLDKSNPKLWWKECKRLCGMTNKSKDIAATLLSNDSPNLQNKSVLANQINQTFLHHQQHYQPLEERRYFNSNNAEPISISNESVTAELNKISSGKANGPDNIPNWVLKEYSNILSYPIASIINSSFQDEKLPTIWKCANVTPLPKTTQVEDLTTDLRPISLTPTLSKIAEEYVVQTHVKPAVLQHIKPDQFGCIPSSSTSHALIDMIHHWSQATDATGNDVRVFALDFKKAFDLIDHSILINKLSNYGINAHILNWICNFLTNRNQRVKLATDCYSEWKSVKAGVPQGTKLGPWLFIVMINDLNPSLANGIFKYVDDTTLHEVIAKNQSSNAQEMITEVENWSTVNKLELNLKKCKELRISFSRTPSSHDNVTINGSTIEVVGSINVLGVTLQNNLKWNSHVSNIVKKASKRLFFLIQLKRAGVSTDELVKFYRACVQPVLLYACQVFHYSLPKYLNITLERVQKRALRIIFGYDLHYSELLDLSNLSSLENRRAELSQNLFSKIAEDPQSHLYDRLPLNNTSSSISLRNKKPMYIPICKTDRFRDTFMVAGARVYNDISK